MQEHAAEGAGRGEYGGTFPLHYPPGTQHNSLRENLIFEHVTDESDVSSAHTHVLYNYKGHYVDSRDYDPLK